jgi:hypothetical protein
MSYKRMNKGEGRLQAEVEEMLRRAEQTDKEEDQLYGVGQDEEGLPAELSRPEEPLRDVQQSCIMVKDGAYIQAYNAQISRAE